MIRLEQMRCRLTSLPVRIGLLALSGGALALAGFGGLRAAGNIDPTAASVLVAIVFGVGTVALQWQPQRRQNAHQFVASQVGNDRIATAEAWLVEHSLSSGQVTGEVSAAERSYVITVLDHDELLAVLADGG